MKTKRLISILFAGILLLTCACSGNSQTNTLLEQKLYVYFIDVGQADCALAVYEDEAVLIDGGNVDDGSLVVDFIKKLGINTLDAVIATHPHEDHIGGLGRIIDKFKVEKVFSPVTEYNSNSFEAFSASANKQCGITVPNGENSFSLGKATVKLLSLGDFETDETNNLSIVSKITYLNTSYLFMGDLEHDGEVALVENNENLYADVLKVGHHGSSTSSSYLFLRKVLPQVAIISCGEGNSYKHPHKEVLDRLEQAEAKVYRTDLMGTISTYSDGSKVFVLEDNNPVGFIPQPSAPALEDFSFIGNKNSKVLHKPNCASLPKEENREYFASKDEAVSQGYASCARCKP